jgi:hypothetical protein
MPQVRALDIPLDRNTQFQVKINESDWFNYPSHFAMRRTFGDGSETFLCPEWNSGRCDEQASVNSSSYFGTVILPYCDLSSDEFCIRSLMIQSSGSNVEQVKFVRSISGPTHKGNAVIGLPAGGTISLFEATQSDKGKGIDGYAVYSSLEISFDPAMDKSVNFRNLDLRVTPYKLLKGVFAEQSITARFDSSGRKGLGFSAFNEGNVWQENGQAGVAVSFSPEDSVELTTDIPSTLSGWLGGRLSRVSFSEERISPKVNRLTVGGNPVSVGRVVANLDRNNPPDYFRTQLESNPKSSGFGYRGSNGQFKVLDAIRESAQDKNVGEEVRWAVEAYRNSTQRCLNGTNRLMGLVATNASVYDAVAPNFVDGTLNYKVAGLHYSSNGEVSKGHYDLVMRSETARCLYGFSAAPIQASVSLLYENGEVNVSTVALSESKGWLHLGAYNFTFSSPVIAIKLIQNASAALPRPTPTQTSKIVPPTKITVISCVKGKVVKKVSGVTPKCPSGYKKK